MRWFAALASVLSCLTLAWAPTAAAHAQEPSGGAADVLSEARLDPVRDRLRAAVEAAEADGLPREWLLDKVAEGLSKRVPPPLIARAVDSLLTRMRTADGLVRDVPNARGRARRRLLRAAVDALAAGAPARGVGRLVAEAARGERAGAPARAREALVTVAELAERGFSGRASVEATREAYRRDRRGGLGRLLRRARRIGPAPPGGRDEALRRAGRAIGIDRPRRGRDHGPHGAPGDRGRGRPR
jgi:hypothetical protein